MNERWPVLANWFGLRGIAPRSSPADNDDQAREEVVLKPSEFIKKHGHLLEAKGVRSSAVFKGDFLDGYGYYLDFDRQLSLDKVRRAGFVEEVNPNDSWMRAFKMFKAAGMIAVD